MHIDIQIIIQLNLGKFFYVIWKSISQTDKWNFA